MLEDGTDQFGPLGHGWTYSAHPIGAAAGVANLQLLDRLGLIENAKSIGAYFNQCMRSTLGEHIHVGEVHGEGLLCAIEFVEDKADRIFFAPDKKIGPAISASLLTHGIIARAMPEGDILGFAPPFCMTKDNVDEVVMKTQDAVKEVLGP